MTHFEMYGESIRQLQEALEALDQAHSTMRDAGVDDVSSGREPSSLSVKRLVSHAEGLLAELEKAECDCGHRLSLHAEPSCHCGCLWGHEECGPRRRATPASFLQAQRLLPQAAVALLDHAKEEWQI